MFGFGLPEMVIILVLVLIVVGPGKLPQMGQALGSSIRNFKRASTADEGQEREKREKMGVPGGETR